MPSLFLPSFPRTNIKMLLDAEKVMEISIHVAQELCPHESRAKPMRDLVPRAMAVTLMTLWSALWTPANLVAGVISSSPENLLC